MSHDPAPNSFVITGLNANQRYIMGSDIGIICVQLAGGHQLLRAVPEV